jgi:hypothetical protein
MCIPALIAAFPRLFSAPDVVQKWTVGVIAVDTGVVLQNRRLRDFDAVSRDLEVVFFARNGVWWQSIACRRVGGHWLAASVVRRSEGAALREVLREEDPGFPPAETP